MERSRQETEYGQNVGGGSGTSSSLRQPWSSDDNITECWCCWIGLLYNKTVNQRASQANNPRQTRRRMTLFFPNLLSKNLQFRSSKSRITKTSIFLVVFFLHNFSSQPSSSLLFAPYYLSFSSHLLLGLCADVEPSHSSAATVQHHRQWSSVKSSIA